MIKDVPQSLKIAMHRQGSGDCKFFTFCARGNKLDEVTIDTYILCATFRGICSVGGNHSKE